MSRVLNNKIVWLSVMNGIAAAFFVAVGWFTIAVILVLCEMVIVFVVGLDRNIQSPLKELTPHREIREIDTLIIGDCCSYKFLTSYFDLKKSLLVMAPNRSVRASFLILQHIASRLDGKNVCIIAPHNQTDVVTPLDASYFSQITKLEIGIESGRFKRYSYLLLHPLMLIRVLLPFSKPKLAATFGKDLQDYCLRKGYNLTCLQK